MSIKSDQFVVIGCELGYLNLFFTDYWGRWATDGLKFANADSAERYIQWFLGSDWERYKCIDVKTRRGFPENNNTTWKIAKLQKQYDLYLCLNGNSSISMSYLDAVQFYSEEDAQSFILNHMRNQNGFIPFEHSKTDK